MALKLKALIPGALLVVLVVSIAGYGRWRLSQIAAELEAVAEHDGVLGEQLGNLYRAQIRQEALFQRILRLAEGGLEVATQKAAYERQRAEFERLDEEIQDRIAEAQGILAVSVASPVRERLASEFEVLANGLRALRSRQANYGDRARGAFALFDAGHVEEARDFASEIEYEAAELDSDHGEMLARIVRLSRDSLAEARRIEQRAELGLLILSIIALALGVIIAVMMSRSLVRRDQLIEEYRDELDAVGHKPPR